MRSLSFDQIVLLRIFNAQIQFGQKFLIVDWTSRVVFSLPMLPTVQGSGPVKVKCPAVSLTAKQQ